MLRVDDRGVGGSTGSIASSTTEDFAGDALAGIEFLKGRKEVDPAKIGLIGHSEGGLIAPLAASRSSDVAFIVLLAGTGLPGVDILKAQGQLISKAEGASEAEMKSSGDIQQRAIDIFLHEKDEKVARTKLAAALKEMLAAMPESTRKALDESGEISEAMIDQFNNAWFRSFLAYDPRPTLQKVYCPVLAHQRREGPASPLQGKPRRDRQGAPGRRQPARQDDRVPGPESPVPAVQDGLAERVRQDRGHDRARGAQGHRGLDRREDADAIGAVVRLDQPTRGERQTVTSGSSDLGGVGISGRASWDSMPSSARAPGPLGRSDRIRREGALTSPVPGYPHRRIPGGSQYVGGRLIRGTLLT